MAAVPGTSGHVASRRCRTRRAGDDRAVLADVVAAERERGDHAEVSAPPAGPEQVAVRAGTGGHEAAIGEHHVGGEQVFDREAEAPGQVADARRGQAATQWTRGSQRAWPCRTYGRVVDVSPGASASTRTVCFRDPRGAAQQGQVDDQGVVPTRNQRVVAAAGRRSRGRAPAETDAGDESTASRQRRWQPDAVDHGVVDGTSLLVPGSPGGSGRRQAGARSSNGVMLVLLMWWSCGSPRCVNARSRRTTLGPPRCGRVAVCSRRGMRQPVGRPVSPLRGWASAGWSADRVAGHRSRRQRDPHHLRQSHLSSWVCAGGRARRRGWLVRTAVARASRSATARASTHAGDEPRLEGDAAPSGVTANAARTRRALASVRLELALTHRGGAT